MTKSAVTAVLLALFWLLLTGFMLSIGFWCAHKLTDSFDHWTARRRTRNNLQETDFQLNRAGIPEI